MSNSSINIFESLIYKILLKLYFLQKNLNHYFLNILIFEKNPFLGSSKVGNLDYDMPKK